MKAHKHLPTITALFSVTLVLSNTLDTKIFRVGSLNLPAGIILFPLAYVFGDVLTEVYGYAASRRVIWTGFASLLLMVTTYEIARLLPPAAFWPGQNSFDTVLGHVPRITTASVMAYFLGEFCNSYVLAKLKVRWTGKFMPVRFVASTLVGQGVDTAVFVAVAFGGVLPLRAAIEITISGWLVKVFWEVVALPITVRVAKFLKHAEDEDYLDVTTNFNPFTLKQ